MPRKLLIITKPVILLLSILTLIIPWYTRTDDFLIDFSYAMNLPSTWLFYAGIVINFLIIRDKAIFKTLGEIGVYIACFGFLLFLFLSYPIAYLIEGPGALPSFRESFYFAIIILVLILVEYFFRDKILYIKPSRKEKTPTEVVEEEMSKQPALEQPILVESPPEQVVQQTMQENLERIERVKTNADFPERWALIYGKKPTERENFQNFKDIELNFTFNSSHPNYFHLKMIHLLEDLNYRIEVNTPPLTYHDTSKFVGFTELNGLIKATMQTSRKFVKHLKFMQFIIGLISVIISLILIITLFSGFSSFDNNLKMLLILFGFFVFLPIGILFLSLFIFSLVQQKASDVEGYSNIYILEQGVASYGLYKTKSTLNNVIEYQKNSNISAMMKLSIASAVKLMDLTETNRDIEKFIMKLAEYYRFLNIVKK